MGWITWGSQVLRGGTLMVDGTYVRGWNRCAQGDNEDIEKAYTRSNWFSGIGVDDFGDPWERRIA